MPASTEVLTCAEVAERLRISQKTVYRLVRRGELPALRFGRAIRIPVVGLEHLITGASASVDSQSGPDSRESAGSDRE